MSSHNLRWIREFIDVYRRQECLWNSKHSDYLNREAKNVAYDALCQKMRQAQPNVTRHDVTAKINNLRSAFRKERKKMVQMEEQGESYTPRLWYYKKLLFLVDSEAPPDSDSEANDNPYGSMKSEDNNSDNEPTCTSWYNTQWMSEFIELYHENESLWNTKCPDYKNRGVKEQSYAQLVEKMAEVVPEADRALVTKKINNMRCSFMKEYNKVKRVQKHGYAYTPKLWYYNQMLFLKEHKGESGSDADNEVFEESNEYELKKELFDLQESGEHNDGYETLGSDDPLVPPQEDEDIYKKPKKRKRQKTTDFNWDNPVTYNIPNDTPADIFGKLVAAKLSTVSSDQRIYLEKIINDAIFEAELGTLSRNSRIVVDVNTEGHTNGSQVDYTKL